MRGEDYGLSALYDFVVVKRAIKHLLHKACASMDPQISKQCLPPKGYRSPEHVSFNLSCL
jgi:hypothetical protein